MIVVHDVREIGFQPKCIITVGTFDGVHAGHRSIIADVTHRASVIGCRSAVVTFDPHPRTVVGRGPVQLLTTLSERIDLIGKLGVDVMLVVAFTFEFSRQTSREFYERYIMKGAGIQEVIIGYDHMFGRGREAGIEELRQLGREFGFETSVVSPVTVDGGVISSSKIRELLEQGNVERAARFLQRPYAVSGTVVHGDGRGTGIGFPTANIEVGQTEKLIPLNGVYLVSVKIGGSQHYGMMNIGLRPTLTDGSRRVMEVHIFDFTGDLYGREVVIEFHKRLRAEMKFDSAETLVRQLQIDREESLKHIASLHTS